MKALCEAGAAEPLAEAFVETIGDAISSNVATKTDISESETTRKANIAESRAEVANVRAELKTDIGLVRAEIGGLEARLYRQLWIMAAGIVRLTVALSSCSAEAGRSPSPSILSLSMEFGLQYADGSAGARRGAYG